MIITNIYVSSRYQVNRKNIRKRVSDLLKLQGVDNAQVDIKELIMLKLI